MDLSELNLPRQQKAIILAELRSGNIHSVEALTERTENSIYKIPGLGDKRVAAIKQALSELNPPRRLAQPGRPSQDVDLERHEAHDR